MSRSAPQQHPRAGKRSFWDICEEFADALTPEDLAQLPKDGADQHDHYIYGTPKREL